MRLTPSNGNQLELRPADSQVRSVVDRNVRFIAQNILGAEPLSEELLRKDGDRNRWCKRLWLLKNSFAGISAKKFARKLLNSSSP